MEISKVYTKDKIKLYFSLQNCYEESTYRIEFSMIYSDDPEETFITEEKRNKVKDGIINFSKTYTCEYDFSKVQYIKLTLKRWKQSKFMKFSIKEKFHLSLSTIVSSKNSIFKTKCKENTDDCETVIITAENAENSNIIKSFNNYNFFDYLKAGIQFNAFIIIDFTEEKLHHKDLSTNQFLQSIQGFRETLFEFVKNFKVYGYGAKLKEGNNNDKKFFNLSLEENAEITGFTKIRNKYFECLDKINSEKSGYLSPVFSNIQKEIFEQYRPDIYNIIFLLIHNKPRDNDIQKSSDFLIETSKLPISIVTIFVGDKPDDEIKDLKHIFSNKKKMSSNLIERTRNNVSFFSMKNCNFNNDILKNKCLRDIPEHLLDYYKFNNTSPKDVKEKNLDKIRSSYKEFDPQLSMFQDEFCAPSIGEQRFKIDESKTQFINKNVNKIENNLIKDNNKNKNPNNKEYFNTPGAPGNNEMDKKYINEINLNVSGNDIINNNNKIVKNPFQKEKKKDKENIVFEKPNQYINEIKMENYAKPGQYVNNLDPEKYINTPDPEKYVNTPDPNKINIGKPNVVNPFKSKKKEKKEDQNEENKNEININNLNMNEIKENNINENEIKEEKKYINVIHKTPDGENNFNNIIDKNVNNIDLNINLNKNKINNIINNEYDEDKKYKNKTPHPCEIIKNEIILNPYKNKANINEEEEKKYQNVTPGNNNNEMPKYKGNPFKNKNKEKNEIKDEKEEDVKEEKKEIKIGSHFKKKYSKDITKLSTKSSNRDDYFDYSRDN